MILGIQNIAILTGWTGSERDVSLRSAGCVEKALVEAGYNVTVFDIPLELGRFIQVHKEFHFAFIMIHGKLWEDGKIPALMELLKVPFQWAPSECHAASLNKIWAKAIVSAAGVPVAPSSNHLFYKKSHAEILSMIEEAGWFPCVIKKPKEGSTIGVYILLNIEDFYKYAEELEFIDVPVMYEKYLDGREFTVSILHDESWNPEVLPIVEIIPPDGCFFDFENKYNGMTKEICPADIDDTTQEILSSIALKSHAALMAQGYSRTDIIMTNEWAFFLELNTIPGFTDQSLFPRSGKAKWLEFIDVLERLIIIGRDRYTSLWFPG